MHSLSHLRPLPNPFCTSISPTANGYMTPRLACPCGALSQPRLTASFCAESGPAVPAAYSSQTPDPSCPCPCSMAKEEWGGQGAAGVKQGSG